MYETHKYGSKLYNPEKPFYKMTIQELCDHSKICKSLDKTSLKKILRMIDSQERGNVHKRFEDNQIFTERILANLCTSTDKEIEDILEKDESKDIDFFRFLRVLIAIVDGIFNLEINEIPNFNFYIFGIALAYTILWMFNKSYTEEE